MWLDREVEEGVSEAEEKIYKRTSISSTRLRQKMRMEVNPLDYAIGGVLFMECEYRR